MCTSSSHNLYCYKTITLCLSENHIKRYWTDFNKTLCLKLVINHKIWTIFYLGMMKEAEDIIRILNTTSKIFLISSQVN